MLAEATVTNTENAEADLSTRWYVVALLLLVVLGVGTRFCKLSVWSYYGDEFYTLERVGDSRTGKEPRITKGTYPLGYALIWVSHRIFGENEFASRFPSALFGAVTPVLLALLCGLAMGRRAGILVGLLVLVYPWHLFWSQMARYYALAFLLGGSGGLLLYLALQKDSWALALSASVLCLLCIASHTTGMFVVAALVLYLVAVRFAPVELPAGLNWRNVLMFLGPFVLALILSGMLPRLGRVFLYAFRRFGKDYGQTAFGGYSPLGMAVRLVPSLIVFAGVPALLLPVFAMVAALRKRRAIGVFFACTFFGTLACGFVYCFMYSVERRYLFLSTSLWFIAAAYGLDRLMSLGRERGRWRFLGVAALLLVLGYYAPGFFFHYKDGARPNVREALKEVARRAAPGDLLVSNCMLRSSVLIYGDRSLDFYRLSTVQLMTWKAGKLSEHASNKRRTWYILEYRRPGLPPAWVRWLWRNCVCVKLLEQPRYGYMEWNLGVFVHDPAWRPAADPAREPGSRKNVRDAKARG